LVDGQVLLDNFAPVQGETFFGQGSRQVTGELSVRAGASYQVEVMSRSAASPHMSGVRIGAEPVMAADARAQAVEAARAAEVAIVVVGYDSRWESEGFDRPDMDVPGDQVALIREVVAANPRTVVVVNAG